MKWTPLANLEKWNPWNIGNYGGGLISCQIVRVGVIIGKRENEGKWGRRERGERKERMKL